MKVLHLYAGNLYGGIETLLVTLARHRNLCPQMEPHFGLCFQARLWSELEATGVPVHDLGPVRMRWPWTVLRARRRLASLLRSEQFDAVVCHACWPHALFSPVVRQGDALLAYAVHGELNALHWLQRLAARTPPDVVIANSRFTAASAAVLFPQCAAKVVYPPVLPPATNDPVACRTRLRAEIATPQEAVVILHVSRIEPLKGHAVLLDAVARLQRLPGWICWIVGGAQRPQEVEFLAELKRRAESYGISSRLRFAGARSDVAAVMSAADVYCQPNTAPEGFGLTFIEALYAGLPVVTTALGGALEIVDDTCGMLVRPNDPAAVANALANLITDPARRRQLGSHGPARARALCDPAAQLSELETILSGSRRMVAA